MPLPPRKGSRTGGLDYLFEPSPEAIFQELLPRYVNVQIYRGMLENAASEQAARMAAMDNASRNCKDLINSLTLVYNKARQSAITKELMDIVGRRRGPQDNKNRIGNTFKEEDLDTWKPEKPKEAIGKMYPGNRTGGGC